MKGEPRATIQRRCHCEGTDGAGGGRGMGSVVCKHGVALDTAGGAGMSLLLGATPSPGDSLAAMCMHVPPPPSGRQVAQHKLNKTPKNTMHAPDKRAKPKPKYDPKAR